MKRAFESARTIARATVFAVVTLSVAACSNHDDDTATRTSPNTANNSNGSSGSNEPPDANDASDTDAGTLYGRLGGNAGIAAIVTTILDTAMRDPVLASYFGASDPKPTLKATLEQDKACLVLQLGQAAGGPEIYPGQVVGGFTCRSMAAAHAGLKIDAAVFDRFIGIAAAAFKTAKVADDDLAVLGFALLGAKADIVTVSTTGNDAGPFPGN